MLRRLLVRWLIGPIAVATILSLASTFFFSKLSVGQEDADQSRKMTFDFVPPPEPFEAFGNLWYIYANGEIDKDAPQRLAEEIALRHIPVRSFLYLNSPGGNLSAGMRLGRLIRTYGFTTYIGIKSSESIDQAGRAIAKALGSEFDEDPGYFRHLAMSETKPGICMSACALTFLGGSFRFLPNGSEYGVHRFYSTQPDALDSDTTQIISASVLQYIRDMGVDQQLFTDMTTASRDDINIMPLPRLIALRVVNNGKGATVWSVEGTNNGIYLKGQRDTRWGLGKLLLQCGSRKLPLIATAIFDPWGRQAEIVRMPVTLFYIDGTATRIPQKLVLGPLINNGWINVGFPLSSGLVTRLKTAQTVGVAVQKTIDTQLFAGFEDMDFSGGAEKLMGLLTTCH